VARVLLLHLTALNRSQPAVRSVRHVILVSEVQAEAMLGTADIPEVTRAVRLRKRPAQPSG
jgi:hypothetical protein